MKTTRAFNTPIESNALAPHITLLSSDQEMNVLTTRDPCGILKNAHIKAILSRRLMWISKQTICI